MRTPPLLFDILDSNQGCFHSPSAKKNTSSMASPPSSLSPSTTRSSSRSRDEIDLEKGRNASISSPSKSSLSTHLRAEISTDGVDVMIILCWFITGFLDSTIFNAYRTFVSMQTGNTIFIGLGASPNPQNQPYGWLKSLTSLITFFLGCLFFSRLSTYLPPLRRSTFLLSFTLQSLCLLLSALLVQTNIVESRLEHIGSDVNFTHLIPIILLSFQAPGQTCMGRQLKMPEVPMVVVTTMIYDFASDGGLFKGGKGKREVEEEGGWRWTGWVVVRWFNGNGKRNRRFGGWAFMLVGAIAGGWCTVWTRHVVLPMWIAAAIKMTMVMAWAVWPAAKSG